MEARPEDLTSLAPQGRKPALTNLRNCSGIGKRCRIHPLIDIVLRAITIYSRRQRITPNAGRGCYRTRDGKWLPALQGNDCVCRPVAYQRIHKPWRTAEELLVAAE